MTEEKNRVRINLPFSPAHVKPNELAPLMTIDGTPIHGVTRIRVEAGVGEITLVKLEFFAEVEGELDATVAKL